MTWVIQFQDTERGGVPFYAAELRAGEPLGFTTDPEQAAEWVEREMAERMLANAFGAAMRDLGTVVEVPA